MYMAGNAHLVSVTGKELAEDFKLLFLMCLLVKQNYKG